MRFELKVALRYLLSSRLQTGLILGGVAIGIVAYTFIAALINGLADRLTDDVIGNIAHVVLEPAERLPRKIDDPQVKAEATRDELLAVQRSNVRRPEINGWRPIVSRLETTPEVVAVSPQVVGGGFVQRGQKVVSVGVRGVDADRISSIVDLDSSVRAGDLLLGPEDIAIGTGLAVDLGIGLGRRLRLETERGRERTLTVRGIFEVGSDAIDNQLVFVRLSTAQNLLDLTGAINRIELKVRDIYQAPTVARRLAAETGLDAEDWIAQNKRLQDALTAQGNTATLVKLFSMLTIVIGVASVLLVAVLRRRSEIGILRSFGVSRRSIRSIFLLQGGLVGLLGASLGSLGGWLFCLLLAEATRRPDGSLGLPVDPAQGEYATAIIIATLASSLAAILPARSAATVDPIEVIQQ